MGSIFMMLCKDPETGRKLNVAILYNRVEGLRSRNAELERGMQRLKDWLTHQLCKCVANICKCIGPQFNYFNNIRRCMNDIKAIIIKIKVNRLL